MKIAVVQTNPRFGDVKYNRKRMLELWPDGADLAVFPELCLSGYLFENREEALTLAEEFDGETRAVLTAEARARNCAVVYGFAEKSVDRLFNSAALIEVSGRAHLYRKMHLFYRETEVFERGDLGWPVCDTGQAWLGLMICFDWRFPEAARTLALSGADILVHPSNLVQPYCQAAMITRCLENRVFAVTANRVGFESRSGETLTFTGESQIVAPSGEVLLRLPPEGEHAGVVELDPLEARNKRITALNDLFGDRRPQHYKRLAGERPYRDNVAIVVLDSAGRVLAGERSDRRGCWQLPQGGVDSGETEEHAALREFREEVGELELEIIGSSEGHYAYDFPDWLQGRSIAYDFRGQRQRYFLAVLKNGETDLATLAPSHEFARFEWLDVNALLEQVVHFKRAAYTAAMKELAPQVNARLARDVWKINSN